MQQILQGVSPHLTTWHLSAASTPGALQTLQSIAIAAARTDGAGPSLAGLGDLYSVGEEVHRLKQTNEEGMQ